MPTSVWTATWQAARAALLATAATAGLGVALAALFLAWQPDEPGEEWIVPPRSELVADGDRVRATGELVVVPGRPAVLCRRAVPPARPGTAPGCPGGVRMIGGDPVGPPPGISPVTVIGVWTGGRIVVEQLRPDPVPAEPVPEPAPPCPEPPGGWRSVPPGAADALEREVLRHPDRYGSFWYAQPYRESSWPPDPRRGLDVRVAVVGTAGDPAAAAARLRPNAGCLCMTRAPAGTAEESAARSKAWSAVTGPEGRAHGVTRVLAVPGEDELRVRLTVVDGPALAWLRGLAGVVRPDPLLRPA